MTNQIAAIRAFFVDPKPAYTKNELKRIFADDLPEGIMEGDRYGTLAKTIKRQTVAAFIRSFVSPVVVGRACGDVIDPLRVETVSVDLPTWMAEALREVARARSQSVGDVIATELLNAIEGNGPSGDVARAVAIPEYA